MERRRNIIKGEKQHYKILIVATQKPLLMAKDYQLQFSFLKHLLKSGQQTFSCFSITEMSSFQNAKTTTYVTYSFPATSRICFSLSPVTNKNIQMKVDPFLLWPLQCTIDG